MCPDCNGTKIYQGLFVTEPCRTCQKFELVDTWFVGIRSSDVGPGSSDVGPGSSDVGPGSPLVGKPYPRVQLEPSLGYIKTAPVAYAKQLRRLLDSEPTMTIGELAKKIGKSPTWIVARLSLLQLIPEAAKLLDEEKMPLSNAYALVRLSPEDQKINLDLACHMSPVDFSTMVWRIRCC